MTQKQTAALEKIIAALPDAYKESFREVAEYAISLGYMPALKGGQTYVDFSKSRIGRTILKIDVNPKSPRLAMKFFAIPVYTGIFECAVTERLAYWHKLEYEAKCFNCGKCDGTQGYTVTLPDGRQGFLCGFGMLSLPSFGEEHMVVVKEALRIQDEFFTRQAAL